MLTQKHSCALHQAYRDVLDRFKSAAGLHEDAMLDVRGNHDAFDIPDRYSRKFKQHAIKIRDKDNRQTQSCSEQS